MNLASITLNKTSQTQKDKYYMSSLYRGPGIRKFVETESRMLVARDFGENRALMFNRFNGFCFGILEKFWK